MNCDVTTEKSNGYCYNIARKSAEERARIWLDLRAASLVRQLLTKVITRRHVEVALYDEPDATREYLRDRINHYMSATRETKVSGKVKNQR